jgi:class 3 adenylate cyclase
VSLATKSQDPAVATPGDPVGHAPARSRWLVERRSGLGGERHGRARRPSLRFEDPDLERGFLHEFSGAGLPLVRLAVRMGIVLSIAFSAIDVWLAGHRVLPALVVRAVFALLLLVTLWSTYRRWFPRVQPVLGPAACVMAALAFDLIAIVSPMPTDYAAFGALVGVVFLGTLMRAPIGSALWGSALITLALIATMMVNGVSAKTTAYYVAFTIVCVSPALGAGYMLERLRRHQFVAELRLSEAHGRSDELLRNVLPDQIAQRLRTNPSAIAATAEEVSVLFADIVGFTPLAAQLGATELVSLLDRLFCEFDDLCDRHGIEKIKTIGDAYMGVAGLPTPTPEHAKAEAELALDMLETSRTFVGWPGALALRVGISSGPVVAGVIGQRKFAYDLWGDTVNTASRMESHAVPGTVQVSAQTFERLQGRYRFGPPAPTEVKGKGTITTYQLLGRL